jgi:hypothetical protein
MDVQPYIKGLSIADEQDFISFDNRKTVIDLPNIPDLRDPEPQSVGNYHSSWATFYDSLSKEGLELLLRLVEENEGREKLSIKREFEPRLEPILEAIQSKNKI